MLTDSAKVFFPISALALVAAIVWAIGTGDRTTVGLLFALLLPALFAGLVVTGVRDSAIEAEADASAAAPAGAAAAVERRELAPSPTPAWGPWPLLVALAVGLLAAGFVVGGVATVAGLIVAVAAAVGWVTLLTLERTGRVVNLLPVGIPFGGLVFVGALMFFLSRILLAVSPHASTAIAIAAATAVLIGAAFFASRPRLGAGAISGVLALAGVLLVAGGLVAAAAGPRAEEKESAKFAVGASLARPLVITAKGIKFNRTELTLSAGKSQYLHFVNDDANTFHNVAIYSDKDFTHALYNGEPIMGKRSADYTVPAEPAGTYFFHCDFHATMQGTVTVGP